MTNSDGQGGNEKGVPQIEVTPEMIEAGLEVYLGFCPDSGTGDNTDRRMLSEIFRTMLARHRAHPAGSGLQGD